MNEKIKIYRSSKYALLPQKGSSHAVGWDIRADLSSLALEEYNNGVRNVSFDEFLIDFSIIIKPHEIRVIPTGLHVELEPDMEMDIKSRSGLFSREGLLAIGTIDPDYRGEIGIMVINLGKKDIQIRHGERIAQAVIRKVYNNDSLFVEVYDFSNLKETDRGKNGFGSTGKK
ncbi:MAG TPA: dUTP diphosphatase [Spirochaetota bacterium]|nr:dUTP diphosphatase [Spirochaetota bacterium]HOM37558.1 dUTP diphosphatase [Spirochaetota bacterium]HPQ49470.1 dUTP diphosphatase [Spirochaetota bacterium]